MTLRARIIRKTVILLDKSAIGRAVGEPKARGNLSPLRGRQPVAQHEAATAPECWVIHKKNQNPERGERVAASHGVLSRRRFTGDGRHQLRVDAEASAAHSLRRGSDEILRLPQVPPQRGSTWGYWLSPAKAGSEFRSPTARQSTDNLGVSEQNNRGRPLIVPSSGGYLFFCEKQS